LSKNDIIIYESTVYPGVTEDVCVSELEKASGLKFNQDFFCGYSPERINPGDKVNTITKIKKITSGSTPEIAEEIDKLYQTIITAGTFKASSIKVAEAAKVIENTQRDLNIALVNELSVIFGRLDLDTLDVLEAAGSKWNFLPFRPGLVGGHCIGVDPYYLTHAAEQVRYNPQVILAGRRINDNMAFYLTKKVIHKMTVNGIDLKKSTVGVMGVTFKENCPDIRNSKIFDIIEELSSWGIKVIIDDPWADPQELKNIHGIKVEMINSKNQVDALIVAVGHDQYRSKSAKELKGYCKRSNPVIADVKSIYKKKDLTDQGFSVFRL
jgi:UDP-N-acetyl-D-galactosamine dehydrogenase